MSQIKEISNNRKAYHEYHILETFQAGIVLTGTGIKSVRAGRVNLKDDFCKDRRWRSLALSFTY